MFLIITLSCFIMYSVSLINKGSQLHCQMLILLGILWGFSYFVDLRFDLASFNYIISNYIFHYMWGSLASVRDIISEDHLNIHNGIMKLWGGGFVCLFLTIVYVGTILISVAFIGNNLQSPKVTLPSSVVIWYSLSFFSLSRVNCNIKTWWKSNTHLPIEVISPLRTREMPAAS